MKTSVHINGMVYDAPRIMQEIMNDPPPWKLNGLEFLIQLLDPSDSPVKFHTSGTTGAPKEIFFSKKHILYGAENTCRYFDINQGSRLFLCLPSEFVAGRMMLARALVSGGELIWEEPSLQPIKTCGAIDFAAFTPAQVATILKDPFAKENFKKIKNIIIGGAEISRELENELQQLQTKIYATYGMTETLTHVAVRKIGEEVYRSVYPDAKFTVSTEQCLEIDLPFINDQKLITADIVELINHQSFKWKGRKDNVINSGGLKLYPEEMETKIISSGKLPEGSFYISSRPDPQFGQSPVLVLLKGLHDTGDPTTQLTIVNGLLNKHEAVKAVFILDKFEYTDNGKLKRQKFK